MKIFLILFSAILGFNFHVIYAQSISIGPNTNEKLTIKAGGSLRFKGMLLSPSIDFTLVQNNISHSSILSHIHSSAISSSYSLENLSLPFSGHIKFFYKDLAVKDVLEANLKLVCYSVTNWITPTQTESNTLLNFIEAKLLNLPISEITLTAPPLIEEESEEESEEGEESEGGVKTDIDGDGYLNENDAFPLDETEWLDTDVDGIGNNSDTDDDGDGQLDTDEITCGSDPLLASSISLDTDGDTIPDCVDTDDDNDGVIDTADVFPLDPAEWTDTDADGIGNNADTDDDNDGFTDSDELACDSDPLDRFNKPADQDNDLIPDCVDTDRDGDGYLNSEDVFPDDADEWIDTDGDGLGDNFEVDDDNDGYLDTNDAFPLDPNEWADTDNDGIGDNADPDDNNDGFEDDKIFVSGALTPDSSSLESTWKVINIERYPNTRVTVYNKNGQEVFSALAYRNDWRGTFKNTSNLLPAASYYYVVDPNNGEKAITGWLYITY